MLYPIANSTRQMVDLSGFWRVQFDDNNTGGYEAGYEGGQIIAVPASWNDQFTDRRDYLGTAWYQTTFSLPWGWREQRIWVRFNSVSYLAEVWLNGVRLGDHEGGHLPFAFDISEHVRNEDNVLVVRVNGELAPDHVPPGGLAGRSGVSFGRADYPDANYDFFPFCGIQRPVLIYTTPQSAIEDITVTTDIDGTSGLVRVRSTASSEGLTTRVTLIGHTAQITGEGSDTTLTVPDAALWSPDAPHLYTLHVELVRGGDVVDRYTLEIGIRTIAVAGDKLLLNGQPVYLRGFGRHEDFPVVGKGLLPALIVKDYELMRWTGANSFRTTHYPYSEQMVKVADQLGFLIIDETPAVGLFFTEPGLARRNELCLQMITELIDRDKNSPSVIMWSLANEPHTAEPAARETYYSQGFQVVENSSRRAAVESFKAMADLARELDPTRPLTIVSHEGATEEAWAFVDVIALNRYNGWYVQQGQIDKGVEVLSRELDVIHERFPGPFILSEFGTDTLPGQHAIEPVMFSEEFQSAFLEAYINMLKTKSFVVGEHVWNLTDFRTSQSVIRVGSMNLKGVFSRTRDQPKMAAHKLRELWAKRQ